MRRHGSNRPLLLLGVLVSPVFLIVLVGWWADFGSWSPARIQESMKRGDRILGAIADFRANEGRFPTGLDELVPRYLDRIQLPNAGSRLWHYRVDVADCTLTFGYGQYVYPCCYKTYSRRSEAWSGDS